MKRRLLAFAGLFCVALALQSAPAAAQDYYGAIAYSSDSGALGWGNDHRSRRGAENGALSQCGAGCSVVLWFKNACGAIATASDGSYGTGWSGSRREAEAIAMNNCRARAGGCTLQRWVCTTR
jgi:serine/threonine-protein kinase